MSTALPQRDEYGRPIQPLMMNEAQGYADPYAANLAPPPRYDDGSGMAPMNAPAAAPPSGGVPTGPPGLTSSDKPNDQIDYNRKFAAGRGDRLNFDAEQRANVSRQGRAGTQAYAQDVYDPLIGNRGGYNQEERDMIYNDQSQYQASPNDLKQNFMTPEEREASQGRPWDRAAWFDSDADMARAYESSGRQRGAVDQMGQELNSAIDPAQLQMDTAYRDKMEGTISGTAAGVRNAVDPAKLRASEGALNDIRMGPEEYQRAITGAGMAAGAGARSATAEVTRAGRAAGMNPMGIAASRARLENDRAVNTGDAMTNARIAAGAAKAGRAGTAEGYRMAGEESAADRGSASQLAAGQFETSARGRVEDQRAAGARDISSRKIQAATTTGGARVGTEGDVAARETASRNFNTTTGTALATGIEQDATARATAAANNRQQVNAGNQATRFGQGTQVSNATTARAAGVGDARRSDAREGRQYLQTGIAGDRADEQADYNRQLGIYGTEGQLQTAATGQQLQQNAQPKWWERALGAAAGVGNAAANVYSGGLSRAVTNAVRR